MSIGAQVPAMRKLSYTARRVITGLSGLPIIASLVNYYADLNWFGQYASGVLAISVILSFVCFTFIGPSIHEMEERREKKRKESSIQDEKLD
jgi:hypothetical protein